MRVEPLVPDVAPDADRVDANGGAFAQALDTVGHTLAVANRSEDAFAGGSGSLADAVYDRAQADVMLSIATAAMQRTAQAITTILNMQI